MTNIGIMTSMPISIDQLSAIQPITGSTNSPGMTHSDPMAKPVARARGGIASDSAASTPGPMIANEAEITQLSATATYTFGANANPAEANDVSRATEATNRMRPLTLPTKRRVAMRAPITRPTSANGSATAAATPRARSSRSNFCSYSSAARVTKPISDVARNGRLHQMRWSDLHLVGGAPALGERRRLLLGVDDVLGGAGRMAFPATADGFLHPQGEHAKITVGMTNTRNGTRQSK